MDLTRAISLAAMPEPHAVCGVRLLPFSIGHWLLLQRCEISFVTGENHGLGDLLMGVMICSGTYEEFAGSLRAGGVERALRLWQRRLSGGLTGRLRRSIARLRGRPVHPSEVIGFDLTTECAAFESYIDEHGGGLYRVNEWSVPVTKPATIQSGDQYELKAPPLITLLVGIMNELHFTFSEAVNMPLPFARHLYSCHAERVGRTHLTTIEEVDKDQESANEFLARVMEEEATQTHG